MLSFADCATLGVAEDSHFSDIARVLAQLKMLESDGFTFMNPSGLMNTFGNWRMTDGNFVPEHMVDIQPPCTLWLSDQLLGSTRRGCQASWISGAPVSGWYA